jgi:hypothetical protein
MIQAIMTENQGWFSQAWDTPGLQEPLYSLLGTMGMTPFADQILDGTADLPEGLDPHTVLLLRALK